MKNVFVIKTIQVGNCFNCLAHDVIGSQNASEIRIYV